MKIAFRRMRPEDRTFVVGSWLSSFRRSVHAGMIAMEDWSTVMVPQIERIVDRPSVHVLVAADPTSVDHIADLFGHIVWEPGLDAPLVFYCYVKHAYRGSGIARGLMNATGIDPAAAFAYVCQTHAVTSLREAGKLPCARWRPLLGRYSIERTHEREDPREAAANADPA